MWKIYVRLIRSYTACRMQLITQQYPYQCFNKCIYEVLSILFFSFNIMFIWILYNILQLRQNCQKHAFDVHFWNCIYFIFDKQNFKVTFRLDSIWYINFMKLIIHEANQNYILDSVSFSFIEIIRMPIKQCEIFLIISIFRCVIYKIIKEYMNVKFCICTFL